MAENAEPDNNPAGLSSVDEKPKKNIGGRPPGRRSKDKVRLQQRIQHKERVIFHRLMMWVNHPDPMASIAAIRLALLYGWGKPPDRLLIGNEAGRPFVIAAPQPVQTMDEWDRLVQDSMTIDTTGEHVGTS